VKAGADGALVGDHERKAAVARAPDFYFLDGTVELQPERFSPRFVIPQRNRSPLDRDQLLRARGFLLDNELSATASIHALSLNCLFGGFDHPRLPLLLKGAVPFAPPTDRRAAGGDP
jgi:hypothetical protein